MIKRRRALTALFFAVGIANLVRAATGLQVVPVLRGWELALLLHWLAGFYALWGIGFTAAAIVVWCAMRRNTPLRWTLPLAIGYQLSLWMLALWAYRSSYSHSLWGRDLVLTGLFLAAVAFLARPGR